MLKEKSKKIALKKGGVFLIILFKVNKMNKVLLEGKADSDFVLKRFGLISKLKKAMDNFVNEMKVYDSHTTPPEHAILSIKAESEIKLDAITKNFEKADDVDLRLKNVGENMEEMVFKLEEIIRFQNCIGTFILKFHQSFKDGGVNL